MVSEITESNGSVVDGFGLRRLPALMDAGVPMKAHVAGIAMGLIKEAQSLRRADRHPRRRGSPRRHGLQGGRHHGGVTALQMDIKIQGITKEIMQVALAQAKEARMHILGKMVEADGRREDRGLAVRPAPVHDEDQSGKIRDVIGKGGATIRALTEGRPARRSTSPRTAPSNIASTDAENAKKRIEEITAEVEIGKVYEGPITKILDFRRARQPAARQGTACCTSARSRTSASRRSPTS